MLYGHTWGNTIFFCFDWKYWTHWTIWYAVCQYMFRQFWVLSHLQMLRKKRPAVFPAFPVRYIIIWQGIKIVPLIQYPWFFKYELYICSDPLCENFSKFEQWELKSLHVCILLRMKKTDRMCAFHCIKVTWLCLNKGECLKRSIMPFTLHNFSKNRILGLNITGISTHININLKIH